MTSSSMTFHYESQFYQLDFDGAAQTLSFNSNDIRINIGQKDPLWEAAYPGGSSLTSAAFKTGAENAGCTIETTKEGLAVHYTTADFDGTLKVDCTPQWFEMQFELVKAPQVVLSIAYPGKALAQLEGLQRVHVPVAMGMTLNPSFFKNGNSIHETYPLVLFSDFLFAQYNAGSMAVYGIQDLDQVFVPARLGTGETDGHAYYGHRFITYVNANTRWTAPRLRFHFGESLESTLKKYGDELHLAATTIKDKLPPDLYTRHLESVEVQLGKFARDAKFADESRALDQALPSPISFVHYTYMTGGWEKEYPDFLPPDPNKGTPEEFAALVRKALDKGHLVEPYVNPTWWGTDPKGKTFQEKGNEAIARDLKGELIFEPYPAGSGYAITPAHPLVKELFNKTLTELKQTYGIREVYLDQVGARWPFYDTNPAAPTPYANIQGYLDFAHQATAILPAKCEGGMDRLINDLFDMNMWYQHRGYGYKWAPPILVPGGDQKDMVDKWGKDAIEFYPFCLYLTHGKTTIRNQTHPYHEAAGVGLSLAADTRLAWFANILDTSPRELEWLRWLSEVQKTVGQRMAEQPLTKLGVWGPETVPQPIVNTQFGDVQVVVNRSDKPYLAGSAAVAANGFAVLSATDDIAAGIFAKFDDRDYEKPVWITKLVGKDNISLSVFTDADLALQLSLPQTMQNTAVTVTSINTDGSAGDVVPSKLEGAVLAFGVTAGTPVPASSRPEFMNPEGRKLLRYQITCLSK